MLRKIPVVLLVLLNFACDQISKDIVREKVAPNDYIQIIEDNFILTNVENTGAMLGMGQDLPPVAKIVLLQLIPMVVLVGLLLGILRKQSLDRWSAFAFACVIGGGIGNLLDRIAYGKVTDFLHIRVGVLKTGIFNMADVSVTLGVLLILFFSLRSKKISL
ncbi:signal peptidase II [Flavobacteriaceae bacterium 3-367]|uniref:signal peptidase II n=1 Tax=Eudoraea algarum TaxID=3417568 RepID=UPI00327BBF6C